MSSNTLYRVHFAPAISKVQQKIPGEVSTETTMSRRGTLRCTASTWLPYVQFCYTL